ncbi:MAG: 16S rRNA (uracil(1498)-N(3))-methyltransferase [Deltaproteobacteria bacterium]|nr:16S rRNA (uracil(1498)-N(3))-methyltransferase [Deltaproteobacteria bacterium]
MERIQPEEGLVRVTGSEARHMIRVLRMGPGDRLVLMDGLGARYQAVIRTVGRDQADLLLERTLPAPAPSPLEITICPSLLKSRPMDLLIQKSSELGVAAVQPYTSSRSVVHLEGKRLESRLRHWREIARNAAKQADRAVPARVDRPEPFESLLAAWRDRQASRVILWESEEASDLKKFLRGEGRAGAVAAVVGPEGGFHPDEVSAAGEAGFSPVSLGRRILRAETAVLAVATLLQYEWGDLSLESQ